ncbi:hypothetical protein HFC70_01015 [Agrobacterium sp. a22-2]|uniref:hypothetical protein n=1 Tax=Agrobacterium sp. a22-2 TaxID=2283840 RepID=UPI00144825E2|nr:hypothetical protein [Agrobacterium sp. a22-2]NKN34928.1 hypothetical protein [Agrobacterium sp. a22-2]
MAGHQNETKRHFELRNLDDNMKEASQQASRPVPAGHVRSLRLRNLALVAVLVLLVGWLCAVLGVF